MSLEFFMFNPIGWAIVSVFLFGIYLSIANAVGKARAKDEATRWDNPYVIEVSSYDAGPGHKDYDWAEWKVFEPYTSKGRKGKKIKDGRELTHGMDKAYALAEAEARKVLKDHIKAQKSEPVKPMPTKTIKITAEEAFNGPVSGRVV